MDKMTRSKKLANGQPETTSHALGALIKSARDIMRKDKGLNGDLDRLPLLTWIMFLKFLDDLEIEREAEATLAARKFKAAIDAPYRWRDEASRQDGVTGDELLSFINQDECIRPDGSRGPGLFAYLRSLTSSNGDDRRDVIATVFGGVDNRMRSGYLLRDVINKIGRIHFNASDELLTLSRLYEILLREMRDAAGDSGEFYTPRPLIRFIVEVTKPILGEVVLDPASGTGGFLVEAYSHMKAQVRTVADHERLQKFSLFGCEAKPLPYLLGQMNLLLHGIDAPQIDPENALRYRLTEIGERDRVDVILTNPPFGGEEEKGIQDNFPQDQQTSETALLFLQLIMRKLRRSGKPGRAAVIVPNGILSSAGVATRVKYQLIAEFNLHTIVRLPIGVFSPYTPIPTNVLFFDRTGPTREIWYFDQPLPNGRKSYTKTKPLRYEELLQCVAWFMDKSPGAQSWVVNAADVIRYGAGGSVDLINLDLMNPNAAVEEILPLATIMEQLDKDHAEIRSLLSDLKSLV